MGRKKRPDGMPRVTLKNIHRIEGQGHGWRVHVKRQRREYVQYFPDGMDGPFQSLREAIDWRDALWRRLGPPTHVPARATRRSSSGVLGVTREVQRTASGRIVETYRAAWTDADKKVRRRCFSVDRYGEAEARRMAIEAREQGQADSVRGRATRLLDTLHMHRTLVEGGRKGTSGR